MAAISEDLMDEENAVAGPLPISRLEAPVARLLF